MDTTLGILGAYPSPLVPTTANPTQKPMNNSQHQSSQVQNDVNTIQDQSQPTDSTSNSSDSQVENSTHLEPSLTPKERSLRDIYAETEKTSPTPKNPQTLVKVNEVIPEVTTRPKRNRKIKTFTATTSRHPLPTCLSATSSTLEPSNYIIASRDPNWVDAMQFELSALSLNNTWTLVPRNPTFLVIGRKWIFKLKYKSDGSIDRYKPRLVAKGYDQQAGLDFHETFSHVVKHTTIRLLLSLAISNQWCIHQIDISNAF